MMRTDAPKDLEGSGFVNFARTTPELPEWLLVSAMAGLSNRFRRKHTMWSRHLAPNNANLGSADLLLAPIDVCDSLAKVESVSWVNG